MVVIGKQREHNKFSGQMANSVCSCREWNNVALERHDGYLPSFSRAEHGPRLTREFNLIYFIVEIIMHEHIRTYLSKKLKKILFIVVLLLE